MRTLQSASDTSLQKRPLTSDISKLRMTLGWICWVYCNRDVLSGSTYWSPQPSYLENGRAHAWPDDHPDDWTSTGAAAVLYGTSFLAPSSGPSNHLRDRASQCRSIGPGTGAGFTIGWKAYYSSCTWPLCEGFTTNRHRLGCWAEIIHVYIPKLGLI